MHNVTRKDKGSKTRFCDELHRSKGTPPLNPRINRKSSLLLPLVICSFFGDSVLASAGGVDSGIGEKLETEHLASLQEQAAQGNLDAMYWLAMLHIEGKISNADYDRGAHLLRQAAEQGHTDSERMWSFMDNAFSGEGC